MSLLSLQAGFDPELSGKNNAILSAMFLGFSKNQALEKLDNIIRFSELGQWIHEPIKTYSTGMRARLGFSVAIQMSPDLLLIDEVLGVGDQNFKEKSMQALKEKINSKMTIIFVSHSLNAIRALCNRVAWLDEGKLYKIGTTEKVTNCYKKKVTI
jgi:lipopolysaccharide transport system ATP-binding protein